MAVQQQRRRHLSEAAADVEITLDLKQAVPVAHLERLDELEGIRDRTTRGSGRATGSCGCGRNLVGVLKRFLQRPVDEDADRLDERRQVAQDGSGRGEVDARGDSAAKFNPMAFDEGEAA